MDLARRVPVRRLRELVRQARDEGSAWPPGTEREHDDGHRGIESVQGGARGTPEAANSFAEGAEEIAPPRRLVRLLVPVPVAAAFDEALDLYRAVAGHEATVTSFVEALVADAMAGQHPPAWGRRRATRTQKGAAPPATDREWQSSLYRGPGTARPCLCRFHHQRGEHGGLASCKGSAPLAVLWRLGKRELGVWYRNDVRVASSG